MECHTEIRQRVAKGLGMHAVWVPRTASSDQCVTCHGDHSGVDFPLIRWQPSREALDHSQTGFPLSGKHATVKCEECHKETNIPIPERSTILVKNLNHTFLGLSRECVSCHTDEHRGQLGTNCGACHNAAAWRPAPSFNHNTSKFPLTGAHSTVACEKCHAKVADAKPYVKYVGLSFAQCIACHADPHKSGLTARCESCHNTTSWKQELRLDSFDHSTTRYPLLGKHQSVTCAACHKTADFKTPMPFAQCVDCHTTDPHKGQFAARVSKGECAECHTVNGWAPSTFGVKEHANSAYPLLGKHADVECAKCHIPAGVNTIYKVKFAQCTDCHQDAHAGQFAKAPYVNRCEPCHTVNGFQRTKYTIAMHASTRYPLEGAHAVVPCSECHKAGAGGRTDKILPFQFKDFSCTGCHTDPHRGEFKDAMAQKSKTGGAQGCEACHNTQSWNLALGFDHAKTEFPLLGAHRTVECRACHTVPAGAELTSFKGVSTNCEYCHADAHGGQFAKNNQTQCKDCHNAEKWSPSTFDHDQRTTFPLKGGHANVRCAACHTQTRIVDGHTLVVYSLAPKECSGCHSTPNPQALHAR